MVLPPSMAGTGMGEGVVSSFVSPTHMKSSPEGSQAVRVLGRRLCGRPVEDAQRSGPAGATRAGLGLAVLILPLAPEMQTRPRRSGFGVEVLRTHRLKSK